MASGPPFVESELDYYVSKAMLGLLSGRTSRPQGLKAVRNTLVIESFLLARAMIDMKQKVLNSPVQHIPPEPDTKWPV